MLDERAITVTAFARAPGKVRIHRFFLSLLSLLLLLLVGTGAAYQAFVNHMPRINIKHAALLPAPRFALSPGETVPTRDPLAGNAENFLLVGSDSSGTVAQGRSDIIVLAHISDGRKQVHLVNFPGDLYVDVPGYGKDTISSAYRYGGSQLLARTVQQLVDVPIDHAGVITFTGLQGMTDGLLGVDVTVDKASAGPGLTTLSKGVNHLDGTAALGFIRERNQPGENDITRGRRQLTFLQSLMVKALAKDALSNRYALAEFKVAATANLTVDNAFTAEQMRSLASALKGLGSKDIVSITAPVTGLGKSATGAQVDVVNVSRMALLSIALRTDTMASFPTT
ncbi:MAG: LytR family transcriptional regulator [Phycicoccus sp.]|nr:LytR family transcriptional regulator [Phycicoccus sp.]